MFDRKSKLMIVADCGNFQVGLIVVGTRRFVLFVLPPMDYGELKVRKCLLD
jgi:hypothetical protein